MPSRHTLQRIAHARLHILFNQAQDVYDEHPGLAHRYMEIARNIAMKVNLSVPTALRRRMCRNCGHYLAYGKNAQIRLDAERGLKLIHCSDCGSIKRIPYSSDNENPDEEPGQ